MDEYNKESKFNNLYILQNYLTFFMILTINLKKYPDLIKTIFTGEMKFFNELVDILLPLKK